MLRWGILSSAKIAREQIIPAHQMATNGVVQAIASRERHRAEQLARVFGIPDVFDSYDALLASDSVDAVYIPLPTSQHIDWTLRAIAAGKHVLCEKPIALQAADIHAVTQAAAKAGVLVAEAFMVHYHPQWHWVRNMLPRIGTLRHVQGVFCYANYDASNMRNQPELGGGGLPDIGVYPLVTTRMSTGKEPQRISAQIDYDPQFGTDRYANVLAQFEGFDLSFYVSTQLALRQSMSFHGDLGHITLQAPFNPLLYDAAKVTLNIDGEALTRHFPANQYQLQAEAFAHAVHSGDFSAMFSLAHSYANQRAIDAIYRADTAGTWVEL